MSPKAFEFSRKRKVPADKMLRVPTEKQALKRKDVPLKLIYPSRKQSERYSTQSRAPVPG